MEASIIVTYRCNARCRMCNIWKHPTKPDEEIKPETLEKLPHLDFCNVTGGEPFLRDDILDIVDVIKKKSNRVVISTNGYLTDRILKVAGEHNDIGIRVSIEGLPAANDELRNLRNGFDHGLRTLLELQKLGLKDIGFGITVSDRNARDMIELYQLAKSMNLEFATAAVHNSFYFHKHDNVISKVEEVKGCFDELIEDLLKTKRVKNWFRAYFNYGLILYIQGKKRLLPCEAGTENFFVDPWGEIRPCNGMEQDSCSNSIGNLNEKSFDEIWHSRNAEKVRQKVQNCSRNCWMIGTASPVMKKYIGKPAWWILKNKIKGYKRTMRVAVLGTRGFPDVQGGVEKHCQELYTRLADFGCQIRVYARKGYVDSRRKHYKGVEIYQLWTPRIKSLEAIFHTILGIMHAAVNRKGFDILHIHSIGPSLLVPLARLLGFRVVVTNHGPDYNRQKWGKLAKAALKTGEKLGAKYSGRLIAVSRVIKHDLEKRFDEKVNYIPNGVNIAKLARPAEFFNTLNITPGKFILAVGRLVPEKGLHDLLDAFKNIKSDWNLVIAGDADHNDNYGQNLKRLAAGDKRVVMAGKINEDKLRELYSNAGLFILPSYHEGLPIVLLEALSYGLNVCCSSIPANTEIVNDPDLLFPPGDVTALRNRLENFLTEHEQSAVSTPCMHDKLKEFDWDVIAHKVHRVYTNLINGDSEGQVELDEILGQFDTVNRIKHELNPMREDFKRVC